LTIKPHALSNVINKRLSINHIAKFDGFNHSEKAVFRTSIDFSKSQVFTKLTHALVIGEYKVLNEVNAPTSVNNQIHFDIHLLRLSQNTFIKGFQLFTVVSNIFIKAHSVIFHTFHTGPKINIFAHNSRTFSVTKICQSFNSRCHLASFVYFVSP
jgi:hypothetical protein